MVDTHGVSGYRILAAPSPYNDDLFIGQSANPGTNVFRVDRTGAVYADGGYHTGGADYPESLAVMAITAQNGAGEVLVIDGSSERRLALANQPYSTLVAGIYSTKPGVVASPHALGEVEKSGSTSRDWSGIVPCKLTAANGPIHRGDLLVTSASQAMP